MDILSVPKDFKLPLLLVFAEFKVGTEGRRFTLALRDDWGTYLRRVPDGRRDGVSSAMVGAGLGGGAATGVFKYCDRLLDSVLGGDLRPLAADEGR